MSETEVILSPNTKSGIPKKKPTPPSPKRGKSGLRSARCTPYSALVKEFAFTYLQREHSNASQMARMLFYAKQKGFVKNPKQFRKWILNEVCKSVHAIDKWLQLP